MLQIKKQGNLIYVSQNILFLTKKIIKKNYQNLRFNKNQLIILRAPKHFNIGKLKINSLNYKGLVKLSFDCDTPFAINCLLRSKKSAVSILKNYFLHTFKIQIIKHSICVKTTFKMVF